MARTNYDDWNIGLKESSKMPLNTKAMSFIFLVCILVLSITSLIDVFSVTFVRAIQADLPSYTYLVYFGFYLVFGLAAGLILMVLPRGLLRSLSFAISLIGVIFLFMCASGKISYKVDETVYMLVFACEAYYLGAFLHQNQIKRKTSGI